jgi:hypothetical protein
MLARLHPNGDFSNATSELGNLARSLAMTKEAHHFYPLLFYFRSREPLYSVSRMTFILLDLTTLIDTTLDRRKHGALGASAVGSLQSCAHLLLSTLDRNFPTVEENKNDARTSNFKSSYAAALAVLRSGGVEIQPGAKRYVN